MSEDKKKSHKDIVERIRKFLAVRVDRGAGEAEALFAARKAAELMAEYDISLADLDEKPASSEMAYKRHEFDPVFSRHVFDLASAIGGMCNVKVLISKPGMGMVSMVGLELDVEVCDYLLDCVIQAMRYESEKAAVGWQLLVPSRQNGKRDSFLQGMSSRLKTRLNEIAWVRRKNNALVVVTDELIRETLERNGREMGLSTIRHRLVDPRSYRSGVDAGDRVALNNALRDGRAAGGSLVDNADV